jgi:SPX domain protein involved in polyphosphate accumulation
MSEYRYERKYTTPHIDTKRVEHMIRLHPAAFKEAFEKRQINNIYFDSHAKRSFHDNVKGISERYKIRVRWYGKLFGRITKPVLEIKIKKGHLGKKVSVKLKQFTLNKKFDLEDFKKNIIKESDAPEWIKHLVCESTISTLSHYERKYFISHNKKFRITIDDNLTYYHMKNKNNTFKEKYLDRKNTIIELKYEQEEHNFAKYITDEIKFRLAPSSKYVNGVNFLQR